ncbi:MAG: S8 family serine peptidase, partial [Chromatiales bacterium]|nr:S8 family serine peptidase [Chromatiales bacterium]
MMKPLTHISGFTRRRNAASRGARRSLWGAIGALCAALTVTGQPQTAVAERHPSRADIAHQPRGMWGWLEREADRNGEVRVVVELTDPLTPRERRAGLRAHPRIAQAQERLRRAVDNASPRSRVHRRYTNLPYLTLSVDRDGLDELQRSADVRYITPDVRFEPTLTQSTTLIGATNLWSSGYTGAGQVVAILDTGVQTNHPFLSGKVVAEACFSSTVTGTSTSVCPDGPDAGTAPDAEFIGPPGGGPCSISGCAHGTHVAGTAAGDQSGLHGVAPDADIIAIQVFSRFDSAANCSPSTAPCVQAYFSDIIAGLDHVYDLSASYPIAAANLSLGGGSYSTAAFCDLVFASFANAVESLKSVDIATVVAASNSGYSTALGAPGCVSGSVTAGASGDTSDFVASFSNRASWLDLFAPGVSIYSSVSGSGYANYSGTSMAAPHITGAFAALRSAAPAASVDEILAALEITGAPITDGATGMIYPRIQVNAAASLLLGGEPVVNQIIDDDLGGTVMAGLFSETDTATGYRGSYQASDGVSAARYRLTPNLPVDGEYRVFAWWPGDAGHSNSATLRVQSLEGTTETDVDLTTNGGRWNLIGDFLFAAGSAGWVEIEGGIGEVIAGDAVRFQRLGAIPLPNDAPVIDSIAASPAVIFDSQTSQLAVSAHDPDTGPSALSYSWSLPPGAGSLDDPTSATPVYTPPDVASTQVFTASVSVSDGEDAVSTSVDITVSDTPPPPNQAPVIDSISATPAAINESQASQLAVSAHDPDAGPSALSYSWSLPPGAGSLDDPTSPTPVYTPPDVASTQVFTASVSVSDGEDSALDSVDITVTPVSATSVVTLFEDDFETDLGWTVNPDGSDTAT